MPIVKGLKKNKAQVLTGGNKLGKTEVTNYFVQAQNAEKFLNQKTVEEWKEEIKKAMEQDPHNPPETLITLDSLGPFTDEELKAAHEQTVYEQNLLAKLKHTSIKPSGPALSVLTGTVPGIIPHEFQGTYHKTPFVNVTLNSELKDDLMILTPGSTTTVAKPFPDKLTKEEIDKVIKKLGDFKKQNPDYIPEFSPYTKETGGEFFLKGYPHFTINNKYGSFNFWVAVQAEHLDDVLTPVNYFLNRIRSKIKNFAAVHYYEQAVVMNLLDNVHGKDDYAKIKRTLLAFFDPDYQTQKNAHMERAFVLNPGDMRVKLVLDRTSDGLIMMKLEVRKEEESD